MANHGSVIRNADDVRTVLEEGFRGHGLGGSASTAVAGALVEAELWGRPTHGLMRVAGVVSALKSGLTGEPVIEREGPSFAHLGGAGCLGYVVSARATEVAADKARSSGLAVIGAVNSAHNGMLGYYVWRLAEVGLVGLAATHCRPSVVAFGSTQAVLGTNPLALACPAGTPGHDPVIIDLATSAVTYGEMEHRRREGSALPEGVALDANGNPTTDPGIAQAGHVLPFGGADGEGKGSALGLLVELLSSLVVGAPPFPESPGSYGHFLFAINRNFFAKYETFGVGWERLSARFAGLEPRPGQPQPRLPGARAMARRREALRDGVRIPCVLWEEVRQALGKG